jgi:mRNA degradation ribonuclease J1/J2
VDAGSIGVVAWYTLSDRAILAENGILTFTLEEDMRMRTIAWHIFIDSRWFVHAHEMMTVHKEILKWIRNTYEKLIEENPKIDRGTLVQSLRREITKYCYVLTWRTPVVMPIVIER